MSTSSSLKAISRNYISPTLLDGKYRPGRSHHIDMRTNRSRAVLALATAGVAWGASVPLSKVALGWLGPGWLTTARFALAALVPPGPVLVALIAALWQHAVARPVAWAGFALSLAGVGFITGGHGGGATGFGDALVLAATLLAAAMTVAQGGLLAGGAPVP